MLIEEVDKYIGAMDRTLTQLLECGCLDGLRSVAVGHFIRAGEQRPGKWSIVDLLYDRLGLLGVPVLGGLRSGTARTRQPSRWRDGKARHQDQNPHHRTRRAMTSTSG